MKGIVHGIIAGVVIIIIGAAILITALALSGWKITGVKFEMQTFTAESENTSLSVDISAGSVVTEFYDGDKVVIEYPSAKNFISEAGERDGGVYYKFKSKWHVLWFNNLDMPQTVIKLPAGVTFNIDFEIGAGTVNIADGKYSKVNIDIHAGTFKANYLECNELDCNISAGTVKISEVVCNLLDCDMSAGTVKVDKITADKSEIEVSAGSAKLGFAGDKSEYGITAKVSAGSCNVGAQTGSTDKTITIGVSAGSVNLSFNV